MMICAAVAFALAAQDPPPPVEPPPAPDDSATPPADPPAPPPAPPPVNLPDPPAPPPAVPGVSLPGTPATVVVQAAPGKGVTLKTGDDRYQLTLRPRIQLRDTATATDFAQGKNEAGVRTVRLSLNGNVLVRELQYAVQLAFGTQDYEPVAISPIYDAYVEYIGVPGAFVRVGQFIVPFDRGRSTREAGLEMPDRSLVVRELNIDRDVGVLLWSDDLFGLGGWIGYSLFVGAGDGRNQVGPRPPGPLVVARLVTRPFGTFDDDVEGDLSRSWQPRLAVEIAGAYNHDAVRAQGSQGPAYPAGTVSYAYGAVDLHLKWAGAAVLGEVIARQALTDEVRGTDTEGVEFVGFSRSGWGWFVQGGYLVTDWLELSGRFDDLHATSDSTDPQLLALVDTGGRAAGVGVSCYLNGHALKLQAEAQHVFGSDVTHGREILIALVDASF